jgi:monoamine oxidase
LRAEASKYTQHNTGAKIHSKLEDVQSLWLSTANATGQGNYLLSSSDHNGTKPSNQNGTYVVAATKSEAVPSGSDANSCQSVIAEFEDSFKPGSEVSAYLLHDWANDPYSKGLWSSYRNLGMSKHVAALQGSHGAVFFASADWSDGWRCSIDGALESGKRAARDVAKLLEAPARASKI